MRVWVLVLSFLCASASSQDCSSNQIACSDGSGCVRHHYICDYDDDCYDGSDEDADLCFAWLNDECSRGQTMCSRHGDSFCVPIADYCSMDEPQCEGDLDRRICEMLKGEILSELGSFVVTDPISTSNLNRSEIQAEKFKNLIPLTVSHDDCPPMYTMVGGQCLSIFFMGMMSWSESREFCAIIGGELATFPDVIQYTHVVQHLQQQEITSDFWIGGMMENEDQGWTWIDGSPMQTGTPFWATRYSPICVNRNVTLSDSDRVCYEYEQAPWPGSPPMGQCVRLSFEHFFYMIDGDCLEKRSPMCQYMGKNGKV